MPRQALPQQEAAALRAAPSAHAWLRRARPAAVAHVFDQAAYLVSDEGAVLMLAAAPLGMAPCALLVDALPLPFGDVMDESDPAKVRGGRLDVGRLSVRFDIAETWDPLPDWPRLRTESARWLPMLPHLIKSLRRQSRGSPFLALLNGPTPPKSDSIEARLVHAATAGGTTLLEALSQSDDDRLVAGALALAGLGGGFTPSGDDFLSGTMMALWALTGDSRRAGLIAEAARPRTTQVSAAWLEAAARGEATEAWHRLTEALADGSQDAVERHARRILQTGHTSGEDALLGFILAVAALGPRSG